MNRTVAALPAMFLLLAVAGAAGAAEEPGAGFAPGELLVKFRDSAGPDAVRSGLGILPGARVLRRFDAALRKTGMRRFFSGGLVRLKLPAGYGVGKAVLALRGLDVVEYAEPNYLVKSCAVPDDTQYASQYGHQIIQSEIAWNTRTEARTSAGADVVVAVLDTGCDLDHEDLAGNIWTNPGETGDDGAGGFKETNGLDDDGNGYVDDWRGWDFFWGDNDPSSEAAGIFDHSTHCCGIIGARGNNALGVCGVCWRVKIMVLKFEDVDDTGTVADAIEAIQYASSFGVRIMSNSWGVFGGQSRALTDAIAASDALFVAAAGNDGTDNDQTPFYPTSLPCGNILSVAASTSADVLTSWSCYGLHSVDIAAPGSGILSTTRGDTYSSWSGTSMSAPFVAGAAALLLAEYPGLSTAELKHKLLASSDRIAACAGKMTSEGRLNISRAIRPVVGSPSLDDPGYGDNDGTYSLGWSSAANAVRYEVHEGPVRTSVQDGAESAGGPWILNGFARSNAAANGGSWSYFSGNANNLRNTMEFNLPVLVKAGCRVSMMTSYNIETDVDFCTFDVSLDSGHHWTMLKIFNGPFTAWRQVEADLSGLEGKEVLLRFRYVTSSAGTSGGFYVDDISISNAEFADWAMLTDTETTTAYPVSGRADGTYRYRVRAIDSAGIWGSWSEARDMIVFSGALQIATESLPDGTCEAAYSHSLNALGGSGAYSWSIVSGFLPGGLTIGFADGLISGTPETGGDFSVTVDVRDMLNASATRQFSIHVNAPPPPFVVVTGELPAAAEAAHYSQQLVRSGGTAPFVWSLDSGSMPGGLGLFSNGMIEGVPVIEGTYSFTVRCTDAGGLVAVKDLAIRVEDKPGSSGCACSHAAAVPASIPGSLAPFLLLCAGLAALKIRRNRM